MNKKILLVCYCILVLLGFSASAQQSFTLNDTVPLPDVGDVPKFNAYHYVFKKRLDSIQTTVPLSYNEYVQEYIDIYAGRKEMIGKMLGLSDYYFPIFSKALKSYNVPEEIKYLPVIESAMDPYAVSRVGATGLWQFMFTTARGYGLSIDRYVDERRDPIQASYAAAAYFRDAYEELGDWLLAIAAYNCGMGCVKRAMERGNTADFWELRNYLPKETRNYVPAFIAALYVMNCADKHEIIKRAAPFRLETDTILVNRFVSIPDLAKTLEISEAELCSLNPSYKKKLVNGTNDAPKRLVLPRTGFEAFARVYAILNSDEHPAEAKLLLAANMDSERRNPLKQKPAFILHRVLKGQNLSVIADKYHVEVQDLKVWNGLRSAAIMPGQKLKIYLEDNFRGRKS
ncbi:lytic transglycosylase domain-containing protein [Pedobacter sp. JY14-1]|uniref:lytic transglycosylase domain-containing protein n=1 Tax=Pedobacter sp. JY14-1 TaxID=3034151 RepID=UPI0023E18D11|nr:lytic transglycosylase domain-containing protein [Pedobacter sp. JY14-1]